LAGILRACQKIVSRGHPDAETQLFAIVREPRMLALYGMALMARPEEPTMQLSLYAEAAICGAFPTTAEDR